MSWVFIKPQSLYLSKTAKPRVDPKQILSELHGHTWSVWIVLFLLVVTHRDQKSYTLTLQSLGGTSTSCLWPLYLQQTQIMLSDVEFSFRFCWGNQKFVRCFFFKLKEHVSYLLEYLLNQLLRKYFLQNLTYMDLRPVTSMIAYNHKVKNAGITFSKEYATKRLSLLQSIKDIAEHILVKKK